MTPLSASTGGRFDGRVASFDLASTSSNMGSIYGDDAHDEVSVDSMDTSRLRAASPAPKSERRWKVSAAGHRSSRRVSSFSQCFGRLLAVFMFLFVDIAL
jgi:hypothetical protein